MKKLAIVGEILWDCIGTQKNAAGAPFNFAKLFKGIGGDPVLLTAVGNDLLGQELEQAVLSSEVRCSLQKSAYQTGYARVFSEHGQNRFELGNPAAWDEIAWNGDVERIAAEADGLYFGTLAQRNEISRHTIHRLAECFQGKLRFCDLNLRPPFDLKEVILWSLNSCEVLKVSDEERRYLSCVLGCSYDDVVSVCFAHTNVEILVETLGDKGARAYRRNGEFVYYPAPDVEVVSTVGAGDAFFASFASKLMDAEQLDICVKYAVEEAARRISRDAK